MSCVRQVFLIVIAIFAGAQLINANVLFRFALDFHVKNGETEENFNKTITVANNRISVQDNNKEVSKEASKETTDDDDIASTLESSATAGPIIDDIWASQHNLSKLANDRLLATRRAIVNLNREFSPVVGRSDVIAAKVKLTTRYLNEADAAAFDEANVTNKFLVLRKFINLVDELRATEGEGGQRSMEFIIMNLVLEKYGILKLQKAVQEEVLPAQAAWQKYVKTKLVEVAI